MVDYGKFVAKDEEKEIMGEKVKIHHLETEDQALFAELAEGKKKRAAAITELILKSLKDDTLTTEKVNTWKAGIRSKFLEAIMIINGYGDELEDAKKEFIARASKQAGEESKS